MSADQLYSGIWTEYYDRRFPFKEYAGRAKLVLSLLKKFNPKAKKMLELACGSGNYTVYFAKKYDVKATDVSKDMLAKAKKKCKAKFALLPMEKLSEKSAYDVIACMYEAFRYLKSYKSVKSTLSKIRKALKPNGLFVVDFHYFPPSKYTMMDGPWTYFGGGVVRATDFIHTKGPFDVRKSVMLIIKDGNVKTVHLKRSPLLRISEKQMRSFLKSAGFKLAHFQRWFYPKKNSMLFIAQK